MTMCKISSFKINNTELGNRPNQADEDGLGCYALMDFALDEAMLRPHEFRFTLRRHKVERTQKTIQFAIAKNILSKKVYCKISSSIHTELGQKTYDFEFEGTIVSAAMEGLNVNCVALSNDYELSIIPRCNYYTKKQLNVIVSDVLKGRTVKIDPVFSTEIPYVVQYNETDYDFLVRLAKQYGEFFYYDQKQGLVFGKVPNPPQITVLKRKDDFLNVQYELTCGDPRLSYAAYHYQNDGVTWSKASDFIQDGTYGNLYGISHGASYHFPNQNNPAPAQNQAPNNANVPAVPPPAVDNNVENYYDYPRALSDNLGNDYMDKMGALWKNSQGASFVVCRCTTYRVDLHVGSIIKMEEDGHDNGELLVTSVRISGNCNGSPINEITAIWRSPVPPYFDVNAYPKSTAQRAIVVNNVDPLKMGRVQVQFVWQKVPSDKKYDGFPWIRIAQPYGGNEKGCYILPEKGEEVMVGFEHDNMEKPFVIGTLFHSADQNPEKKQMPDDKWVSAVNEVKAFRTKKGHTIEFHDVDGDGKYGYIRIYGKKDPNNQNQNNQNTPPFYDIILSSDTLADHKCKTAKVKEDNAVEYNDELAIPNLSLLVKTNNGSITLDAGEGDIVMKAANIRLDATNDITTIIGGNNIMKVTKGQYVEAQTNSLVVQDKQTIVVNGVDTETYNGNVTINANQPVEMKAKDGQSNFTLKVDAKSLDLTTTGDTTIKGANIAAKATQGKVMVNAESEVSINTDMGKVNFTGNQINLKAVNAATVSASKTQVSASGSMEINTPNGKRSGKWTDLPYVTPTV